MVSRFLLSNILNYFSIFSISRLDHWSTKIIENYTRTRTHIRARVRVCICVEFFPKFADHHETNWHNWWYTVNGSLTTSDPLAWWKRFCPVFTADWAIKSLMLLTDRFCDRLASSFAGDTGKTPLVRISSGNGPYRRFGFSCCVQVKLYANMAVRAS